MRAVADGERGAAIGGGSVAVRDSCGAAALVVAALGDPASGARAVVSAMGGSNREIGVGDLKRLGATLFARLSGRWKAI